MNNNWQAAIDFFISTFTELALLFLAVSFIVSAVNHYLPSHKVTGLLSGNRGYGIAMSLGALTPFCSCSTLPMMVGLLKARAAFGPLMAFLITSPLLNPFVFSLFWITFGAKVTAVYAISVIAIASLSGFLLQHYRFERFIRPEILQGASGCDSAPEKTEGNTNSNCNSQCKSEPTNVRKQPQNVALFNLLAKGAFKQLTELLPYMVIGVAVGAALHGFVPVSLFERLATLPSLLLIPLAALIGIFLYVRASTMIPIAASLIAKGLSTGAVMSLTIAGAGASLPEMIMLKKMFHWPLLLAFIFLVLATACITGFTIELLSVY
ncbi:permease [Lacimicrobium sp. SS2-24]|uniref:permease n=1 Tax=Lacimicrobium sp. SS2-24 TaxID=2005569 RepID=UPI000B4C1CBA|nr:permease [Lacimicrobium sp. SS2-24]